MNKGELGICYVRSVCTKCSAWTSKQTKHFAVTELVEYNYARLYTQFKTLMFHFLGRWKFQRGGPAVNIRPFTLRGTHLYTFDTTRERC